REVRQADVRLARAEVAEAERQFINDVQHQFVLALAAKAKIEVLAELEAGTTAYVDLAKQRLEVAQGSQLDVTSVQIEVVLAKQAKQQAEGDLREAEAALRPLLGLTPDAGLTLSGDLSSVIAALRRSTRLTVPSDLARADIVAAQLKLDRAESATHLAHSERREDWEWFVGYESERSIDQPIGAERDHFFGVGLRIPLPLRNKGEGRIAEAKAQAEQAQQLLAATRLQASGEVASAIEAVRKAQVAGAGLRDETLPLLDEREAKTREAYEQGVIDFTAVLQLQQQRARLREALLVSDQEHALALARLQAVLGSNPNLKTQLSDS
ncbi:MAG: TolC family protein, partial [Verrucomicrobiota bacterium]